MRKFKIGFLRVFFSVLPNWFLHWAVIEAADRAGERGDNIENVLDYLEERF